MITLTINGQRRELADGTTLAGLIEILDLARRRVAVERNREIVKQALWPETTLADGDELEVLHFVGGG
ncbi:MAG: sulfur carrier protein ThiS [Candidatus Hydrogenedentota bacterium]